MTEIAVYGLPVRMPHWSFGARYIYQLLQRHMGYSRLFEVVFPGNPGHAYLAASNGLADNVLVTAHVLGHADFSKNNMLFRRCQDQGSAQIIEHAASHARQIERDIEAHGFNAVEQVLDAALSLEQYVDLDQSLRRERLPGVCSRPTAEPPDDAFRSRFATLDAGAGAAPQIAQAPRAAAAASGARSALVHRHLCARDGELGARHLSRRARGILLFLSGVRHADHERGLGLLLARAAAARSGFHSARRPISTRSSATRTWCARSRPASRSRSSINPYHLGFTLWEEIVKKSGIDAARRVMREDDDFSFLRNHLTREIAAEMGLFRYQRQQNGPIKVVAADIDELHESLLLDKYNFGAPRVSVAEVRNDGTLVLAARQPARRPRARRGARAQGARVHQARLAAARAAQDGRCRGRGGGILGGLRRRLILRRLPGVSPAPRRRQLRAGVTPGTPRDPARRRPR